MNEINRLVEQVKQATDYQINKQIMREKMQSDLHFAYNNGLFRATPELIAFLDSWDNDELFIEDTYQNPIKVNRSELLLLAKQHYQMVMNTWHIRHEELKRARKI